jgi:hypothetical protein
MNGIFVHGTRPKSKREIRDIVMGAQDPSQLPLDDGHLHDLYCVVIEDTTPEFLPHDEFDGSLAEANRVNYKGPVAFVGPDPYTNRKFYGTLELLRKGDGSERWVVK